MGRLTRPLLAALAVVAALMMAGCDKETTETFTCRIGGQWFTLETALTPEEQAKGMGGRTEIADDGGMIFVFDRDEERSFWMKDCLIEMDILFVDRTGRVVSTHTMKPVPLRQPDESEFQYEDRLRRTASYPSRGLARYVIELRAGKVQELGVEPGQKLDVDLERLNELAKVADGG